MTKTEGSNSFFIPSHKLGVLEHQMTSLASGTVITKRTRLSEFRRFARIIKDLKLIPEGYPIIGLSIGIRSDGEAGLVVNVKTSVKLQGDLPA